jgi:ornithine decarboxylase
MEKSQEYDGRLAAQNTSSKIHFVDFRKTKKFEAKNKRIDAKILNGSGVNSVETVAHYTLASKPSLPVYFIRPQSLKKAASWFLENFKSFKNFSGKNLAGDVLYSVKSNPDAAVLQHLFDAGIRHFDVASMAEINLINNLFGKAASMYFMHPIKSREAIYEAYFVHGIRDFSLDSFDELKKILEVTSGAKDLGLHVRLAIPNSRSAIDLSGKFGVLPSKSVSLLRKVRAAAKRFGVCFHVGSQCMDPTQYRATLMIVKEAITQAKVRLDVLDIGGGFPSVYPGMTPPNMQSYVDEIQDALMAMPLDNNCKIWCEPGRALVAESGSLLVRVEARKENMLYINDGTYGGLFDAGFPAFIYPTKSLRIKKGRSLSEKNIPFGFYGPTCDSLDTMKGPFYLPENISEGDYIEIGQLGAYSKSIRTEFNGFNQTIQVEVGDEPLSSMYLTADEEEAVLNNQK